MSARGRTKPPAPIAPAPIVLALHRPGEDELLGAFGHIVRAFNFFCDPDRGYSFPAETRQEIEQVLKRLIFLHMHGGQQRSAAPAELDGSFQRFLRALPLQPPG
jgi:hypothetical protein